MSVLGIDQITYGAADLPRCRQFFLDWGLALVEEAPQELVFESLNGCRVVVAHSDKPGLPAGVEPDPTLREVVWGVDTPESLALYRNRLQNQPGFVDADGRVGCTDPNGLAIRLQLTKKTRRADRERAHQHLERAQAREPAQPGL